MQSKYNSCALFLEMCLHVGSQQLIQMSNGASSEDSKNCIFIFTTFLFFHLHILQLWRFKWKTWLPFFCLQGQKPSCSLFSFSVCSLRETHMLLWDWLLMILTKHWVSVMWAHRFFPPFCFLLKGQIGVSHHLALSRRISVRTWLIWHFYIWSVSTTRS